MKKAGKDCVPVTDKRVCNQEELKTDFVCNKNKTEICLKKTNRTWWIVMIFIICMGLLGIGIVLFCCLTDKQKWQKKKP